MSYADSPYDVAKPLDAIGDGWSLLIARDAFNSLRRFDEFQHNLGLSKNALAVYLRNPVVHDTLETVPVFDSSAYQDYVLTEKECVLFLLPVTLRQWSEAFYFTPDEAHVALVDKITDKSVPHLELRAQDERALTPEDTMVVHPSAIRPAKCQWVKAD